MYNKLYKLLEDLLHISIRALQKKAERKGLNDFETVPLDLDLFVPLAQKWE